MAFSVLLAVATEYHYRNYPRLLELSAGTERLLFSLNAVFVFVIVGLFVYTFFRATHEAEALLEEEQARSERLLLNVLPPSIAARLKAETGVIADQFDSVTVLFADIVGFTKFSGTVGPAELVDALNDLFSAFDDLARSHGAEKIKTIGDAYMVAAGIPEPAADHAERIARLALDMQRAIRAWDAKHRLRLDLRIGMHSGSVVAGVIGKQKFSYDLWGDTVNTASRMESHGEPGRIHLSDDTARLLQGNFRTIPRGTIEVKGKGPMTTSFLDGEV
jgi:class 3 adenylate cyclase